MPGTMRKATFSLAAGLVMTASANAAPKLDKETCDQLKGEQAKFLASGIIEDIQKGAEWGKGNLPPERLREIEHFILLDEQLKFGCRIVTMTADIFRAGEAAMQLEAPPEPPPPVTSSGRSENGRMSDEGPVRSVTPKPKPKPAASAEQRAEPAPAAVKPKPKPKPKSSDDAYVPERSGPPVNP
jgi:hypothetical protein